MKRIINRILAITASILFVTSLIKDLNHNVPPAEWVPNVTLAVLFLLVYIVPKLASRIEDHRADSSEFGLIGWSLLVVFAIWVFAGFTLIYTRYDTMFGVVKMYTAMGAIGLVFILIQLYSSAHTREKATG